MTAAVANWRRGEAFFGLARLRADGALDPTFGTDGIADVFGARQAIEDLQAQGIAAQTGGRTLVVGYRKRSSGRDEHTAPLMVRLRPDGTLDPGFGDGGVVMPPMRLGGDAYRAVAVQRSGRIVAVGARNEVLGGRPAGLVVAYRRDGSIDRRFGDRGRVLFPAARDNLYTGLSAVTALDDGKLLVSGYRHGRLIVARLRPDGGMDRSFGGGDGTISIDIGDTEGCLAACGPRSALVAQGEKILVLGSRPSERTLLTRLNGNGRIDRSFGQRGFIGAGIGRRLSNAYDIALQKNGRIVVVGADSRLDADDRIFFVFGTLRFLADGQLDRSFGSGGLLTLPNSRSSSAFAAVAQPTGRVMAGGGLVQSSAGLSDSSLLLARFLPTSAP